MNKIKKFIENHTQKLIIVFTAVLFCFSLASLIINLDVNTMSNDECWWISEKVNNSADSVAIRFERVKINGVTWNAGIRDGDYLLAINGVPLKDTKQAQSILNKIKAGEYAHYKVKKSNGKIINTDVYIKKLVNFFVLTLDLLGFIWLIIGFIVVSAKPDGYIQRRFYAISTTLVMFGTFIFLNLKPVQSNIPLQLFFDLFSTFGAIFTPFLVIHFFFIFPRELRTIRRRGVKKALYIIPLILFASLFLYRIFFVWGKPNPAFHYKWYFDVIVPYFFTGFYVGLVALIINYFKLKSKDERKPIFIILIAYILGIASVTFSGFVAPAIADTFYNSPEYYMPILFIIVLPIGFAYSIFKYQLMDVSVVIKNTIIYGAATLAIAVTYFVVIYGIGLTISSAIGTEYQGLILGVIFIIFAVIFQSSKDKFQDFITAKFYPEQFAYQKVLVHFSSEISSMVGLDNILDYTKQTLIDALMINHFGIMLKDNNSYSYSLVRSIGMGNVNVQITSSNETQLISGKGDLANTQIIEREKFEEVFPEDYEKFINGNIYTIIPMVIKSKVVGLMLFGLKHSGSQFGGKDLELLSSAASQTAVAIENARLYQAEAQKLKMERDLDLARKIQQGLLPACIPNIKGLDICGEMIPAMQVGGDYYDLIPVSENKMFVVVGDVSGKGLSAALYMTKLQTMIQLACTVDKSPREILIDVNKRMYTSLEKNSFVTMTLALFDMNKKTVKFCRAGHMPILTTANGTVNAYKTQGLGVGLEYGAVFESTLMEEELILKSGQIYAFFSDGITEAMNEKMDLFGEENLSQILSNKTDQKSADIMNEIWNNINTFRGKAEQNDDMTMVLVKIN